MSRLTKKFPCWKHIQSTSCRLRPLLTTSTIVTPSTCQTSHTSIRNYRISNSLPVFKTTDSVRDLRLQLTKLQEIQADPTLWGTYILDQNGSQPHILDLFTEAICLVTSPHSQVAYKYILASWQVVFTGSDAALKLEFMKHKDRVIHIMINKSDYQSYKTILEPTLGENREVSLAELTMRTFQFQRKNTLGSAINVKAAIDFFSSLQYPSAFKHQILSLFVRKSLLYHTDTLPFPELFSNFLIFSKAIAPLNFLPRQEHARVYDKAFALLAIPPKKTSPSAYLNTMKKILLEHATMRVFGNLLSCLMRATATNNPKMAKLLWTYKLKLLEPRSHYDLTSVMLALYNLQEYASINSIYTQNTNLHDDLQIEILLNVSAKKKDTSALQVQFEGMYGLGDLPQPIHYSIAMSALVEMGARNEIGRLMEQFHLRNLKPNIFIYKALLQLEVNDRKFEAVSEIYNKFLEQIDSNGIPHDSVAKLLPILLQASALQLNAQEIYQTVDRLLRLETETDFTVIDSETVHLLMRLASTIYSKQLFERAFEIAIQLNLFNDFLYHAAITTLTNLGEYDRAEALATEGHLQSDVPYQSSLIYSAQLKNLRVWATEVKDRKVRERLEMEINTIVKQVKFDQVSRKDKAEVLTECAKVYLQRDNLEAAREFFKLSWQQNNCKERHFTPLLRYYRQSSDRSNNSKILGLYEFMVSKKVEISAETYSYVTKALFTLQKNKTDTGSALKVLQPVLNIYNLNPGSTATKSSVTDLMKNAVSLIQILSDFVSDCRGDKEKNWSFVSNVMDRLQLKLGKSISLEYRKDIYLSFAQFYYRSQDLPAAQTLINRVIQEYYEIFSDLDDHPKLLLIKFKEALDLKFKILDSLWAPDHEYEAILKQLLSHNINLDRPGFEHIFEHLLNPKTSFESLKLVLEACERFLVAGNMADVKLMRLISNVYRSFLCYKSESESAEQLNSKYEIFNKFYGVDEEEIKRLAAQIGDLREALMEEMKKLPIAERVSFQGLIGHPARLFVPGRSSWQKNYISPTYCSHLLQLIDKYCELNFEVAYELYEQFPETFEYLLIFREERFRFVAFRNEIHKIAGGRLSRNRERSRQQAIGLLEKLD